MAGSRKCEPGCTCKKHSGLTEEEREQRHRDQSREGMARWRERHPGPGRRRLTDEERSVSAERKKQLNREYARNRRATDPEYVEKQRERNRVHGRKYHIKSKYGITIEQWDAMLVDQSGRCYLCERPMDGTIHIDHDHSCCSGKASCGKCIRGLACQKCNQGVGQFADDPYYLRKAADNLEKAIRRLQEGSA